MEIELEQLNLTQKQILNLLPEDYVTVDVVFGDIVRGENQYVCKSKVDNSNLSAWPYEVGDCVTRREKHYTYKAKIEDSIKVGDRCVVCSPTSGYCIVTIVKVHKRANIDFNTAFEYKWIVQRVDTDRYENILKTEAEFMESMRELERLVQRETLIKKIQNLSEGIPSVRDLFANIKKKFFS